MEQTVQSLTHHGMGRLPNGDLVKRVLPKEVIALNDDGSAKVLQPSPDRVAPVCRHFKSCGGCSVMHGSDAFVAEWKTGIVRSALRARGLETDIRAIFTSAANSRRRAKLSGRRTKKGALVGFHAAASSTLIEVPDCQLLTPQIVAGEAAMKELTVLGASRKSEVQMTVIETNNGLDVSVEADRKIDDGLRVHLANIANAHRLARLSWNGEPVVTLLPPSIKLGKANVVPPPGAFLQATKDAETIMVSAVKEIVGDAKKVVDLFSGCGTFSYPLAENAEVHAVEGEADLTEALDLGWRNSTGLKRVTTEVRDLFRRPLEPDELNRFGAAVLDPPRAGADAQIQALTKANCKKIAMVSCNPITFARDAETLVGAGYHFDWILPVDQFRWSHHVEVVGSFTRK